MSGQTPQSNGNSKVDRWGAAASSLCALHCAACALLPATMTALGLGFLFGHEIEWALTLFAVGFAAAALWFAWRSHASATVMTLLAVGIVGLLSARFMEGEHHDHHGEESHHAETNHGDKEAHHGGTERHHDDASDTHKDVAAKEHGDAETHHKGEAGHHGDEGEHGVVNGELLGVIAGLVLVTGHVGNIRALRRREDDSETSGKKEQDDCCG